MGCVSSNLLNHDDDFTQIGSSALGHHIVSLTSTTYGLLTLDPPPSSPSASATTLPPPQPRFPLSSIFPSPLSDPRATKPLWSDPTRPPEVINSWELMAGLDADSFRFPPLPRQTSKSSYPSFAPNKENSNPNSISRPNPFQIRQFPALDTKGEASDASRPPPAALDGFEFLCPPRGEDRVVIYTTTLRGVRKTFEDCNAARAAIEGLGVAICERDVSMDSGFRDELRELMKGRDKGEMVPPRIFVRGRYLGGVEELMRFVEGGGLGELLDGLPKRKVGVVCEGCGGVRFLPCFQCNGSCKVVVMVNEGGDNEGEGDKDGDKQSRVLVVRCPECNENGLVLCPLCS